MGFLANKRILVTGFLSNRSIAYGVAQAMYRFRIKNAAQRAAFFIGAESAGSANG